MKYFYTGPTSGVTLNTENGPLEVMLHTRTEVTLPEENEYVKTLIALKHLHPATATLPKSSKAANKEGV